MTASKKSDRSLDEEAAEKLRYLNETGKDFLARLSGVGLDIAEAAVQLLPLGSRLAFYELGFTSGESASGSVRITSLGRRAITAAAALQQEAQRAALKERANNALRASAAGRTPEDRNGLMRRGSRK